MIEHAPVSARNGHVKSRTLLFSKNGDRGPAGNDIKNALDRARTKQDKDELRRDLESYDDWKKEDERLKRRDEG